MGNSNSSSQLKIGIDVGGTNTDAVLMDGRTVVASTKQSTTKVVNDGITAAVTAVLKDVDGKRGKVQAIMVGTTHFLNAVVQRKGLAKVALFRLTGYAASTMPPMTDWEDDLTNAVDGGVYNLEGGYNFDGNVITEVDEEQVRKAAASAKKSGVRCCAVVGVFSPIKTDQEERVRDIILDEYPSALVTISSDVAQIGFLERENAVLLNASLVPLAHKTLFGLEEDLHKALDVTCPVFLTQNDGTLLSLSEALRFPIKTFASGPTNSMRGAAFLTGLTDCIVADIGGTTTDVGILKGGFPRESNLTVELDKGVRTNFRMPNVYSFGLGGGSIVDLEQLTVGPLSVGYELTTKSRCFGGNTLTASDVATYSRLCDLGTERVLSMSEVQADDLLQKMVDKVLQACDMVKLSNESVPIVLVGGGSVIIDQSRLKGMNVTRPEHFGVANAIGAAISQVSGTVDQIRTLAEGHDPASRIANAKKEATAMAIAGGAVEKSIKITECEEIPAAYLPGNVARVRVKAVGDMNVSALVGSKDKESHKMDVSRIQLSPGTHKTKQESETVAVPEEKTVRKGRWILTEADIDAIAVGAGVLGTGGGGSTYINSVRAKHALREGKEIAVIPMADVKDKSNVAVGGMMGAPSVMAERPGDKYARAVRGVEKELGLKVHHVAAVEIGGSNGIEPMIAASELGVTVVDGDFMGRAFPELQMCTCFIGADAISAKHTSISAMSGKTIVLEDVETPKDVEVAARGHVVEMGCTASLVLPPIKGKQFKKLCLGGSVTRAWRLGKEILRARADKTDPIRAILNTEPSRLLFQGKISLVTRKTDGGFTRGEMELEGLEGHTGERLRVDLQNEYLMATRISQDGKEEVLASVPDLICLVELDTAAPIFSEEAKYGLRVGVLAMPIDKAMTSEQALKVVGPSCFGYTDVEWKPCLGDNE